MIIGVNINIKQRKKLIKKHRRKLPIVIVVRNRLIHLGEGKDVKKDMTTICGQVGHLRHLEMMSLDITGQTKDDGRIIEMADDIRQRVVVDILFT
jgi:hypothetical protein